MNAPSLWAKLIALSCVLLFAKCATAQDEIPAADNHGSLTATSSCVAPDTKQRLLSLVPTPAPAHAALQNATAFYSPATLYQYMDGGADIYLLYDFQLLLHQEFKAKEVDVTVDIFDMGTQEHAFGMYASERSPSYQFISIGTEGYRNEGILNFLKGRYYVKLAGFGAGADPVLDEFARAIAARIEEKAEFPALLQKLPQANRKLRSEQYLLKDPLGNAFLGPAYLVSYADESTLLVSVAADPADAHNRLALLTEHFRKTGTCAEAADVAPGAIRASNSFEGKVLAAAKGNYVLVLYSKGTGSDSVLKEALRNIQ
jgi:hypothetical protein